MSVTGSYGVFRTALAATTRRLPSTRTIDAVERRKFSAKQQPWTCPSCLYKTQQNTSIPRNALCGQNAFKRPIATSVRRQNEHPKRLEREAQVSPVETQSQPDPRPQPPSTDPPSTLPSESASQRWHSSERLSHLMDTLLARASIASQRINTYTGTDYTGIETLRQKIVEQEATVKHRHTAVNEARTAHREAHAKQSGAQKEIVSLLERKSSWSPSDLERYMSLVRSEHSLESDVSLAKDNVASAERELEDARGLLERLERKQYHEEQIWSDTIRRNSTWVTFGLMGVNIVLLLAQIAVFEPYRRRKIVREVKVALDEKVDAAAAGVGATVSPAREVEKLIDAVVEPAAPPLDVIEEVIARDEALSSERAAAGQEETGKATLTAGEVLPEDAVRVEAVLSPPPTTPKHPETWSGSWEATLESLQDLFSERIIQVKKVDLTTVALQGAATGVAAMGLLFVMFRPR